MLVLARLPSSTSSPTTSKAEMNDIFHPLTLLLRFSDKVMPTLGVDFSAKNLPAVDNSTIRLHLWDVAGRYSGRKMNHTWGFLDCRSRKIPVPVQSLS